MTQTIEAICENGALRPMDPNAIAAFEGRRVTVTIRDEPAPDPLDLLGQVYDGLSRYYDINYINDLA